MRVKRLISVLAAVCLSATGLVVLPVLPTLSASALQGTVPANTAPTWQTNGTVRAIAAANGVVYIGGDFTSVRPPGAAPGTGEVARNHLAAFNASTGALITGFNHTVNANVFTLALSPDNSVLYMGGDFSTVDSSTRNRVAAFATATGALTSWAPNGNARVAGIAATASTVFVGGSFSQFAGAAHQRVAAVSAATGANVAAFQAGADNSVYDIALSKAGDKLYLAGAFGSTNGNTSYHNAAAVDAGTGALLPFAAGQVIPVSSPACVSEMKSVITDDDSVYFGAEGTGGGCFDGTFAANVSDGTLKWQSQCLGATQTIQVLNGLLYTGSHSHDCTADQGFDPNAFPEVGWGRGLSRHLLARSTANGKVSNWYPNTNGGPPGGQGPRSMGTDGTQLFVGGEFTTVNGVAQQGFTRFSPSTGDLAAPARPSAPVAVARDGGKVSVFVQVPLDNDDPDLVVRLYRDGGSTPIATAPYRSLFWKDPVAAFEDTVTVGTNHTYAVDVAEANGPNVSPRSPNSAAVTGVTTAPAYQQSVDADNPTFFWRLNEASGPAAADSSDSLQGGIYSGSVSYRQAGQVAGNSGIATDGSTAFVSSSSKFPTPNAFSVEAWFRTTSSNGGKIIGFGDRQLGYDFSGNPAQSGQYDKQVYMLNDGRLRFGVWVGFADTLTSTASYNDGQYHHVVGTLGAGGMALYVDGARVARNGETNSHHYDGYWRVGGDNLGGWPDQPNSNFFQGTIDDVAVYPTALARARVVDHFVASGRAAPPSVVPADTYGAAVFNDSPVAYWRLDETSGSTAADTSDSGNTGQYIGGVTPGAAGALSGGFGNAATFDGSTGNVASSSSTGGPSTFSTELWFKTTTTRGGKLIGFGNSQTGNSGAYDKHVWMTDSGRLEFGVYNGSFDIVRSAAGQNDGSWHHVVATQDSSGMKLYLDDALVDSNGVTTNQGYGGYWRVGGDNLAFWPDRPTSDWFAGTIDEVAVYANALTATQVDNHYHASGRSGPDLLAPDTAITSPPDGATIEAGSTTVEANASDNVGVTGVDLQVDGSTVDSDATAPYSFTWTATEGDHTLRTVAHDAAGNDGTSTAVDVTVIGPDTEDPTASITSPSEGDNVFGTTTVTAIAGDNRGVTAVQFLVDGSAVGNDTTAPYSFDWNAVVEGAHTLQAVASDAAGNTGASAIVHVTVPPDTEDPSAPTGLAASNVTKTTVDLAWNASTDDRGVTGYRVVRNGTVLPGTLTVRSFSDTGLTPGTAYSYTVRAVDAAGNVSDDSNTVNITTLPEASSLYSESWPGADGSGWPAAWATGSANGSVTTQSGEGRLSFNDVASAYARAQLTAVTARPDADLLTSYRFSSTAAGSYFSVYVRGSGGWQNGYRPLNGYGLQITPNSGTITLEKNVAGTRTTIQNVSGAQAVSGAKHWLRLRVTGTTVQFRTWLDGTSEPSTWAATVTDSSVSGNGQVFVSLNRAGSNVGAKFVALDDLVLN
jgi:hypothetical protein